MLGQKAEMQGQCQSQKAAIGKGPMEGQGRAEYKSNTDQGRYRCRTGQIRGEQYRTGQGRGQGQGREAMVLAMDRGRAGQGRTGQYRPGQDQWQGRAGAGTGQTRAGAGQGRGRGKTKRDGAGQGAGHDCLYQRGGGRRRQDSLRDTETGRIAKGDGR